MAIVLMRVIATALALLAGLMAAAAQDSSQAVDGHARMKAALELFATNSYAKILDGVEVVAGSGVEHAGKTLTLLSRRRVYVTEDGSRGAFRDGSTYCDFVTGAALEGKPDGADGVRVNNRVRNEADLVLALGTRFGETDWWGKAPYWKSPSDQKLIQVDIDPEILGAIRRADLAAIDGSERWLQGPWDRLLLDPARNGAADVVKCIGRIDPARIVYVSCHPGTLARDAGTLVNEAGYTLDAAGIIDMFPHTAHVESIAVFKK